MIHVIHKTAQREGPREEEPRKPQLVQVPEAFRPPLEPKESSVEQARGFHHEPDGYRWSVLDPNISLKPFHVSHDLVYANGNGAHHEGPHENAGKELENAVPPESIEELDVDPVLL